MTADVDLSHKIAAAPPSAPMGVWTDQQCLQFAAVAFRHSPKNLPDGVTLQDIRLAAASVFALAQQPAACRCVDCEGDQPGHDPCCEYMRDLHGEQPAAEAVALTVCCGREECGGECGGEWRGMEWVRLAQQPAAPSGEAVDELKVWGTQRPGRMPKLFGLRTFAELNWYPDEGYDLVCLQVVTRITPASHGAG